MRVCRCVARRVFREVWCRYIYAAHAGMWVWRVGVEKCPWGFLTGHKHVEFAADVVLSARRVLDDWHFQVWKVHFLEGKDWRECLPPLRRFARLSGRDERLASRGHFFHSVYRVEERLGRTWAEMEPYPLFPTRVYYRAHWLGWKQIPKPHACHPRFFRTEEVMRAAA